MSKSKKEKELMFEFIKKKYGDRLEAKQLEAVQESLESVLAAVKEVRKVPLENRNEPFNIFKPYRREQT